METVQKLIVKDEKKFTTLGDLIKRCKLKIEYFSVLVNGKRQAENYILSPDDKIIILPKIRGGVI